MFYDVDTDRVQSMINELTAECERSCNMVSYLPLQEFVNKMEKVRVYCKAIGVKILMNKEPITLFRSEMFTGGFPSQQLGCFDIAIHNHAVYEVVYRYKETSGVLVSFIHLKNA